jgi:hypothetical protein
MLYRANQQYDVTEIQGNQEGSELNAVHQIMPMLIGRIWWQKTGGLLHDSEEVGLEINANKSMCLFMPWNQIAEQNYYTV